MEFNLGELIEVELKEPKSKKFLAQVKWIFEKGELKWGTIANSKYGGLWVQLPKISYSVGIYMTPLKIIDKNLEKFLSDKAIEKYGEYKNNIEPEIDLDEIEL